MNQREWVRGFVGYLVALLLLLIALVAWVRWMIVEPHWLEVFR